MNSGGDPTAIQFETYGSSIVIEEKLYNSRYIVTVINNCKKTSSIDINYTIGNKPYTDTYSGPNCQNLFWYLVKKTSIRTFDEI